MSSYGHGGQQGQQQQQRKRKALARAITAAANNGSGLIRITATAHGFNTSDPVKIAGVGGTVEANGKWTITVIAANTFDLQGSTFTNAFTSGGTATRTQG